jgi:hypothetical protein
MFPTGLRKINLLYTVFLDSGEFLSSYEYLVINIVSEYTVTLVGGHAVA